MGKVLCSLEEIGRVLGGQSNRSVRRLKTAYPDMPIKKVLGGWGAEEDQLIKWWASITKGKEEPGESSS